MAIVDKITGFAGNYGQAVQNIGSQSHWKTRYFDCSAENLTSGDFVEIFDYAANTAIIRCIMVTETVEGAADTCDLVDDDTGSNTLISNHNCNVDNTLTESSTHVFKATAGQICLKPDADLGTCKFWIAVEFLPLNTDM